MLEEFKWLFSWTGMIALTVFVVICTIHIYQYYPRWRIKRWEKSLSLDTHAQQFEQVYQDVDGFKLSSLARQKQDAIEYVYGEIEFTPFIALLSLVKPDKNTVFYDLGSGVGKAVLATAMVFPVAKSVGIELFPELHRGACAQNKKLAILPAYAEHARKILFIEGDFLTASLEEATLIFINSTTLIGENWNTLCHRLNHLPKLNTVITTTKPLANTDFTLIKTSQIQMSWGIVFAFIQVKKTNFY